jgi:hypothetical protein
VIETGPAIVLPTHGPVAASPPTTTMPTLESIENGPLIDVPQIRTSAAPDARTGPEIVAPSA